ncbi:MAG: hypothetical protein ACREMR_00385, partial [Gemmatimonadales bacterium]
GEVVARLAAEAGVPVRRARVALDRDILQLRTITPAPPLRAGAARAYVALEAPRLFRRNGWPLVTDAVIVRLGKDTRALWAAAAPEPLVRAVLDGCAQAGLAVDGVTPAADVLSHALGPAGAAGGAPLIFVRDSMAEVVEVGPAGAWRSRLVRSGEWGRGKGERWVPALLALGGEAPGYAGAYAAAVGRPRFELLPPATRAARARHARRLHVRVAALGVALWVVAATLFVGRLSVTSSRATHSLDAVRSSVDSALAVRRDLAAAGAALDLVARAERGRSRHVALAAELTRALGDSIHLVALRVGPDGTVRLVGYAPVAARALAALEQVPGLRDVRFEGAITREVGDGRREMDRFAIVARMEATP